MEKVKLSQLVSSEEQLFLLSKAKLPNTSVKTKYWISKLVGKIKGELVHYNEVRLELLEKYGEKNLDEKGEFKGTYNIKKENVQEFNDKIKELGDQEVELEFKKINVEELESEEVTIDMLSNLDWLVSE